MISEAGSDKLTGGSFKDVFVYNGTLDEGRDTITDFQDNKGLIQIEGVSFTDLTIQKTGGGSNTKIILDSGTEIILQNAVKADIGIDDFVFIWKLTTLIGVGRRPTWNNAGLRR